MDNALAEGMWESKLREQGNFGVLHTLDDYSDIDRHALAREKVAHWMARYEMIR